jgi:hypothetical protein
LGNKMKITRFLYCAAAADGGTIACRVTLDDGRELDIGLDGRIPKTKKDRVLFVGAGYPTEPEARILARDSKEEEEAIQAIQTYAAEHPEDEGAGQLIHAIIDR